ncbi:MAG: hypothetical protein ABJQ34_03475 [Paracoccaceae bacterium]
MKTSLAALVATGVFCTASFGQTASQVTLSEEQKRLIEALLTAPVASPGVAIGVPSGFGAAKGQAFASIGGTTNDGDLDGSANVGLGFGNPSEYVGVELNANIFSLTDNGPGSGTGEQGSLSVKVTRQLTPTSSLAFGAENALVWGDETENVDPSFYLAYSNVNALSDDPLRPMLLTYTIGVGNERFGDFDNGVRTDDVGIFGAVGLAVTRRTGVILDYNGNFASAGVSFVPIVDQPLTVSLSVNNFTSVDAADGGTLSGDPEFGVSVGYSWQF